MAKQADSSSAPELHSANTSPFQRALKSVISVGRELLAKQGTSSTLVRGSADSLTALCKDLLDHRGEASGLALAEEIAGAYKDLDSAARLQFLRSLAAEFSVDRDAVLASADRYRDDPSQTNLESIAHSVEAPRQQLFRRISMAPEGTRTLVALRGDLLGLLREYPELKSVDSDLKHLFVYWFNKGLLELRQIDWSSPAIVLEKLIEYEAVHAINGWEDLRGRLREDRRCFAFFHPARCAAM